MGAYLHHHSWSSAASWKQGAWNSALLFFPAIPPNTSKGFTAMQKRIKPPLGKININVDAAIGELQACCAAVIRNFRSPVNHHGYMQSILSRS
uniref:Uncharacterized protein n=1 Tax=Fagus sylvatica TaxID=28930 RepID=A0A2N9EGF1_FAGSY